MRKLITTLCLTVGLLFGCAGVCKSAEGFLAKLQNSNISRLEFQLMQICSDLEKELTLSFATTSYIFSNLERNLKCIKTENDILIIVFFEGGFKKFDRKKKKEWLTRRIPNRTAIDILRFFGNNGEPNSKDIYGLNIVQKTIFKRFRSKYIVGRLPIDLMSRIEKVRKIGKEIIPKLRIEVDLDISDIYLRQYSRLRYRFNLLSNYKNVGLVFEIKDKKLIKEKIYKPKR
tara:strand:- start:1734 stop:2423 length:690 start_codon:yes stop_codon:yes gene_type:complete